MKKLYFDWLCKLLESDVTPPIDIYENLLKELHNHEYIYAMRGDYNRSVDGLHLRTLFEKECIGRPYDWGDKPCTVLEMLIGLAYRIEQDIMQGEPGSSVAYWFWMMIDNLGLIPYMNENFDKEAVIDILLRFLNRRYGKNGEGSIFFSNDPRKDYRKTELWYQANWYLSENYI